MLWCDTEGANRGDFDVSLWWEGALPTTVDGLIYLEYTYWLDKQEGGAAQTSYWAWFGSETEWHLSPETFIEELRSAHTLDLRLEGQAQDPFEATFNLTGIEWAISRLPCIS